MLPSIRPTSPVAPVPAHSPLPTTTAPAASGNTGKLEGEMASLPERPANNARVSAFQSQFIDQQNAETRAKLLAEFHLEDIHLPRPQPGVLLKVDWSCSDWRPIANAFKNIPLINDVDAIMTSTIGFLDEALAARNRSRSTFIVVGEQHGDKTSCAFELAVLARMRKESPDKGVIFYEAAPDWWTNENNTTLRRDVGAVWDGSIQPSGDTFSLFGGVDPGVHALVAVIGSRAEKLNYQIIPFDKARIGDDRNENRYLEDREEAMLSHITKDKLGDPETVSAVFVGTVHVEAVREKLIAQGVNVVTIAAVDPYTSMNIPAHQDRFRYLLGKDDVKIVRVDSPFVKFGNFNVFAYQARLDRELGDPAQSGASSHAGRVALNADAGAAHAWLQAMRQAVSGAGTLQDLADCPVVACAALAGNVLPANMNSWSPSTAACAEASLDWLDKVFAHPHALAHHPELTPMVSETLIKLTVALFNDTPVPGDLNRLPAHLRPHHERLMDHIHTYTELRCPDPRLLQFFAYSTMSMPYTAAAKARHEGLLARLGSGIGAPPFVREMLIETGCQALAKSALPERDEQHHMLSRLARLLNDASAGIDPGMRRRALSYLLFLSVDVEGMTILHPDNREQLQDVMDALIRTPQR